MSACMVHPHNCPSAPFQPRNLLIISELLELRKAFSGSGIRNYKNSIYTAGMLFLFDQFLEFCFLRILTQWPLLFIFHLVLQVLQCIWRSEDSCAFLWNPRYFGKGVLPVPLWVPKLFSSWFTLVWTCKTHDLGDQQYTIGIPWHPGGWGSKQINLLVRQQSNCHSSSLGPLLVIWQSLLKAAVEDNQRFQLQSHG